MKWVYFPGNQSIHQCLLYYHDLVFVIKRVNLHSRSMCKMYFSAFTQRSECISNEQNWKEHENSIILSLSSHLHSSMVSLTHAISPLSPSPFLLSVSTYTCLSVLLNMFTGIMIILLRRNNTIITPEASLHVMLSLIKLIFNSMK